MKLTVKVTPNAKKDEVVEDFIDLLAVRNLKIKTAKPPENGKANEAVIEIVADYFKVKKRAVKILLGETSRTKLLEIEGL